MLFQKKKSNVGVTMDLLEFSSNLVQALAWPIAAVCIVLQFKKALSERIPALLKLTLPGGISAEFNDGFERIAAAVDRSDVTVVTQTASASEAPVTPEASRPLPPEPTARADQWNASTFLNFPDAITVNANPTGVVMEAWKALEVSVSTAFIRLGGMNSASGGVGIRKISVGKMARFLEDNALLTVDDLEIIRELQRLRNLAAHASEPTTPEAAKSFAGFAFEMATKINSRSAEFVVRNL